MGSFTQLSYHIFYANKFRRPSIVPKLQQRLYQYIGGTILAKKGCLMEIGGVADHIHILTQLSATLPVADVVRDIKANSSRWMNEQSEHHRAFEWQKGYGAFSVSYLQIEKVRRYIQK